MAHEEQYAFCKSVRDKFPELFKQASVLDIGSMDVNGNNRYLFTDSEYVGCDLGEGANVDVICPGHEFDAPTGSFDVVISTEAFEHDKYIAQTLPHAIKLLRSGGMLIFTCAGPDRWEHGTDAHAPDQSPFTNDYYGNVSITQAMGLMDMEAFKELMFRYDGGGRRDLQFWGIKK